jgi:hypothetical protein
MRISQPARVSIAFSIAFALFLVGLDSWVRSVERVGRPSSAICQLIGQAE